MRWRLFLIIILILEGIYFLTEFLFSYRFGRELKIKGIVTLFHGRIDSLPLTR